MTTSSSSVPLFFTFSFVNDATASSLESRDPQNEVVSLICGSVMDQAGGTDVKLAAIAQGVIFQTDSTIGECQIVAAHRITVGVSGLFTLELEFRLSVFASTTDVALLTQFIEVGFAASSGGRATFLNRLTTGNDYFDDLQDADILAAGKFTSEPPTRSPFSSPPTFKPTPTIVPTTEAPTPGLTMSPTRNPTSDVSLSPTSLASLNPTTTTTTQAPSSTPSFRGSSTPTAGSLNPSSLVTEHPSISPLSDVDAPSNQPDLGTPGAADAPQDEIFTPLVMSAIALGSLAGVMFCCLAVRYFYSDHQPEHVHGLVAGPAKVGASLNGKRPLFPDMVQLDDDNQSLANTTLGEHTAGRNPPKKAKGMLESDSSFDDSVYTSTSRFLPVSHSGYDDPISLVRQTPVRSTSIYSGYVGTSVRSSSLDAPSILGSVGSSFAASDRSKSDMASSQSLDFATDFGDGFFFGDDDGILSGVNGATSPVADKIEDMVSDELNDSYSDSESNTTADDMAGVMDLDSPLDLLRLSASNVFVVDNDESSIDVHPKVTSGDARKIDFESVFSSDRDMVLQNNDTSTIRKVANSKPLASSNDAMTKARNSTKLAVLNTPDRSSTSSSVQDSLSQSESPQSSAFGSPGYHSPSPSQLQQQKPMFASHPNTKFSPAYKAKAGQLRITLDQAKYSELNSNQSSRSNDEVSPLANTMKSIFASASQVSLSVDNYPIGSIKASPKNRIDPLSQHDRGDKTPPASIEADLTTPAKIRRIAATTDLSFGPIASFNTANSLRTKKEQIPNSPAGYSSSSEDENAFLFGAIERTLGPRSPSADMESLGGRSGRSRDSEVGSRSGRHSQISVGSEEKSEMSMMTPRTLAHVDRLELQLSRLRTEAKSSQSVPLDTPSVTSSTGGLVRSTIGLPRTNVKNKVVIVVPPGKLGVVLANRRDRVGTFVAEVKNSSSLKGALSPGDKLVAIDGVDVTSMVVSQITSIMLEKSTMERHLTVITASKVKHRSYETMQYH